MSDTKFNRLINTISATVNATNNPVTSHTTQPTCGEEALGVEEAGHPVALGPPAVQPAVQLLVARQQARKPAAAAAGLPAACGGVEWNEREVRSRTVQSRKPSEWQNLAHHPTKTTNRRSATQTTPDLGPAAGHACVEQRIQRLRQLIAQCDGSGNGQAQIAQGVAHQRHHTVQPGGGGGCEGVEGVDGRGGRQAWQFLLAASSQALPAPSHSTLPIPKCTGQSPGAGGW